MSRWRIWNRHRYVSHSHSKTMYTQTNTAATHTHSETRRMARVQWTREDCLCVWIVSVWCGFLAESPLKPKSHFINQIRLISSPLLHTKPLFATHLPTQSRPVYLRSIDQSAGINQSKRIFTFQKPQNQPWGYYLHDYLFKIILISDYTCGMSE